MFESSGKLDEAFYRETWWKMFGRRNKLSLIFAMSPIVAAAALMVYWRTYSHLWLPALLLLALFVYTWRFVARRRRLSQERLREINGVPESLQHFVKNSIFKTFGTFAFIQSVFLLGSIYFKRNAVGKTMLAIAFFGTILIAIEILFIRISFGTYSLATNNLYLSHYDFNQSTTLNVLSKTFEIGSYLVVPFLWIVSYFRLTEKEV